MSSAKTKFYNILKILNTRINNEGIKQYLVLWENNTQSWINQSDISKYSIDNHNKISTTNNKINSNAMNSINKPVGPKKAFIYTRTSPKTKNSIQQKLSNLNINGNSNSSSGSSGGGSASGGNVTNSIVPMSNLSISNETICDSIKTQEHYCLKYCIDNNMKVEFIASDENVSARNMNNLKKELGFFTEHLTPNESCIVIYTPDRLSRHSAKGQAFLEQMMQRNIDVHFVKEGYVYNKSTPSHIKHQIYSLLNNAEFLSNQTSERIKNTLKRKRAEGHQFGRPRYGYEIKMINGIRKFKPHKQQQKIISNILNLQRKLDKQNDKTIKQVVPLISAELNRFKITNTRNLPFTKSMLTSILKRNEDSLLSNKNDNMYVNLLGDNLNSMSINKSKNPIDNNNNNNRFNIYENVVSLKNSIKNMLTYNIDSISRV